MTNSLLFSNNKLKIIVNEWEKGIIAPKLTIRQLADELHFHLRIYMRKKYSLTIIVIFLFFNLVQRILYTLGTKFGSR